MRPNRRRPLALLALAMVLSSGPACVSSADKRAGQKRGEPEPYVPLPPEGPETIGFFLASFDRSLAQWSELKLGSAGVREQKTLRTLEENMQERARKRRDELLTELEGGVPVNRRIAAAALGFTHDPSVLGPLLASLSDPDPELAQRTLLALGVLALPETPPGGILERLQHDRDAWTRNNAAYALLAIARAGSTAPELAEGCRAALSDSEAGVRAQCASTLGMLADPGSVQRLSDLLQDEANLVALAASASLAQIGRKHPEQKGAVARAMAAELDAVRADRRQHLMQALRWLSGTDYGPDASEWLAWAHKLP
jgi:HEAT repeat protein